ncbi:hypothetical protein D3C80_1442720 [compost metagenome]
MGVDLVQANQVIIDGTFDGGVEVLADVDPQDAGVLGRLYAVDQVVDAKVVEAHAVDDGLGVRQAEDAWFGVARLRTRRHRADFDEAEPQLGKAVDGSAILVQACGQPHRVWKIQAHDGHCQFGRGLGQHAIEAQTATGTDQVQGQVVGGFRGKFEQ